MEAGRTFDILETCCFPEGCMRPKDLQLILATVFIPKLEAAGMTVAEWTRGALMLEDPHYKQVRSIVCRRCVIAACRHNPNQGRQSGNLFDEILNWSYTERLERNAELSEALLPASAIADWAAKGLEVEAYPLSSRTRFSLGVSIKHPEAGSFRISLSRKKGELGEIFVTGTPSTRYPLPRSPKEASEKLLEIINAML